MSSPRQMIEDLERQVHLVRTYLDDENKDLLANKLTNLKTAASGTRELTIELSSQLQKLIDKISDVTDKYRSREKEQKKEQFLEKNDIKEITDGFDAATKSIPLKSSIGTPSEDERKQAAEKSGLTAQPEPAKKEEPKKEEAKKEEPKKDEKKTAEEMEAERLNRIQNLQLIERYRRAIRLDEGRIEEQAQNKLTQPVDFTKTGTYQFGSSNISVELDEQGKIRVRQVPNPMLKVRSENSRVDSGDLIGFLASEGVKKVTLDWTRSGYPQHDLTEQRLKDLLRQVEKNGLAVHFGPGVEDFIHTLSPVKQKEFYDIRNQLNQMQERREKLSSFSQPETFKQYTSQFQENITTEEKIKENLDKVKNLKTPEAIKTELDSIEKDASTMQDRLGKFSEAIETSLRSLENVDKIPQHLFRSNIDKVQDLISHRSMVAQMTNNLDQLEKLRLKSAGMRQTLLSAAEKKCQFLETKLKALSDLDKSTLTPEKKEEITKTIEKLKTAVETQKESITTLRTKEGALIGAIDQAKTKIQANPAAVKKQPSFSPRPQG